MAPNYKNYLVFCDESGIHGARYYGFGSLWMPWERRGDFASIIAQLRARSNYSDEAKWTRVGSYSERFYLDLIDVFFQKPWLMFHALIVRRGYTNRTFHKDFDEEKRKRFAMLIEKKIAYFCGSDHSKRYHVRVDPLPSRYSKADEAAEKIVGSMLMKELGLKPLASLYTRRSTDVPGIQVADFLLGATLADWQGEARSIAKLNVRKHLAEHLGWPDMKSDTQPWIWKFNVWYFFDPKSGGRREIPTRPVNFKLPIRQSLRGERASV